MTHRKKSALRPFWQDHPCPPWCTARHRADDPPGRDEWMLLGRVHTARVGTVDRITENGGGAGQVKRLAVHVRQEHRETEPTVVLVLDNPDDGAHYSGRHINVVRQDTVEEAVAVLTAAELGELRGLLKRADRLIRGEVTS